MFVSFEPLALLFWVFISSFIPGAIFSFGLFKKDDLSFLEKLFIGFALGFIALPLIPFLSYFFLGVKFSYEMALLAVAVLYVIGIATFALNRAYEGIRLPSMPEGGLKVSRTAIISILLVLLVILAYQVRVGSYSPIFQELDPYFYTFPAHQLLTMGENPFDDQTAWYPEVTVNHRIIPEVSYLEAIWYSLYTGGGEYSNMLLAVIASMYPPIAAALAVFFIYLLVSSTTKREWGLVAAGIAAFVPIFIFKLAAGEQEVQPYAFFSLMFFYAMYALAVKRQDMRFSVLAGLGFAAVALGSSSQLLALVSVMLFMGFQGIAYFLRDPDERNLKHFLITNSIVFALGPLFGSAVLKDFFAMGHPSFSIIVPFFLGLAFVGLLFAFKRQVPDRAAGFMFLVIIAILGLIFYAVTPVGDFVKNAGKGGFQIAEYNRPLDRTIAEQGTAPTEFGSQIGFIAETYKGLSALILWPISSLLGTSSQSYAYLHAFFELILSIIGIIFSIIVNIALIIFVAITNIVLGTSVDFNEKSNSLLLFFIFAFWAALAISLYTYAAKGKDNLYLLMLALVMPPLVVGLIKAKYTIYSGVLLAVAIGFSLGAFESSVKEHLDEVSAASVVKGLLVVGAVLVLFQFAHSGFAMSLLWGSAQPLYQNDPGALQAKFQTICAATADTEVCAAAADPLGYANRSTNNQYSTKLCMFSIYSNHTYAYNSGIAPPMELTTVSFRCQRITDYWIDSMEWIRDNTEEDARVISWWDYGHWINYFGDRDAVLRNEHASHGMIGATADRYLDATPQELKDYMEAHDSEYALFDVELIAGGGSLGGKYGALNYLSCAWNNETSVANSPGSSDCETDHLWETIVVSSKPCTISSLANKTGLTAYKVYAGPARTYVPYYPTNCMAPGDTATAAYCRDYVKLEPTYCVGEVLLATGEDMIGTYYLNETYANGDLKLNKGILQMPSSLPTTSHVGPATTFTMFYTDDMIWLENGEVKSGYEDRKGKFYDSNLYRAIFVGEIPGFELVYSTSGGAVKIFKIVE